MESVELRTAFHWFCEECASENFSLPQKAELTDDDAEQAFRLMHCLEDWQPLPENWRDFELSSLPRVVTCSACQTKYRTAIET